jgi:hypothetical protein
LDLRKRINSGIVSDEDARKALAVLRKRRDE